MTSYILETGSLAEVWSSLPYGSKELLHDDSNQVVNFDGILTFYDSEHIRALSSKSYSPEATMALLHYYKKKNERIASNVLFNSIFLKYANLCCGDGKPVNFATAVAHFRSSATEVKEELMAKRFLESSGSPSTAITTKEEGVDLDHNEVIYALGITKADSGIVEEIAKSRSENKLFDITVDADNMHQIDQDEVYELTISKHLPSFVGVYQSACTYKQKVLDGLEHKIRKGAIAASLVGTHTPGVRVNKWRALDEDDNELSNDTTDRSNEVNSEIVSFKYNREGKILAGEWHGESLLIYTPPTQQQMNLKMTAMRHALCTITIFVCLLFYIKKSRQVFLADLQHKKKRK